MRCCWKRGLAGRRVCALTQITQFKLQSISAALVMISHLDISHGITLSKQIRHSSLLTSSSAEVLQCPDSSGKEKMTNKTTVSAS